MCSRCRTLRQECSDATGTSKAKGSIPKSYKLKNQYRISGDKRGKVGADAGCDALRSDMLVLKSAARRVRFPVYKLKINIEYLEIKGKGWC